MKRLAVMFAALVLVVGAAWAGAPPEPVKRSQATGYWTVFGSVGEDSSEASFAFGARYRNWGGQLGLVNDEADDPRSPVDRALAIKRGGVRTSDTWGVDAMRFFPVRRFSPYVSAGVYYHEIDHHTGAELEGGVGAWYRVGHRAQLGVEAHTARGILLTLGYRLGR